jgi:hypothetical protein
MNGCDATYCSASGTPPVMLDSIRDAMRELPRIYHDRIICSYLIRERLAKVATRMTMPDHLYGLSIYAYPTEIRAFIEYRKSRERGERPMFVPDGSSITQEQSDE